MSDLRSIINKFIDKLFSSIIEIGVLLINKGDENEWDMARWDATLVCIK